MTAVKTVRTWRVGTISMGASLLFLGVFLLLSQFLDLSLMSILISWWPVILIVLGIEILLYLFVSRNEKPFLKYDFLSIFFVGIIGTVGIIFAVVSSLGLTDIAKDVISSEEQTVELPPLNQTIDQNIKRIVLKTDHENLVVEGTKSQEVSMFGTYRATLPNGQDKRISNVEDYMSVQIKGDTMYLQVKSLPRGNGPIFQYYSQMEATLLIPDHVKFELIGQGNDLTLKPRELNSNWVVESVGSVSLQVQENSDIEISASQVESLQSEDVEWTQEDKSNENKNGRMKIGEGTHSIDIMNAHYVNVSLVTP
ncbi:LiaF transmembrane domain-containing protein [Robertmurraya massiliosenegalensis]|uniref:LiaF transmembrane domain-containing protein n=1 Tax=Robertmurraya massiliosenegalensis TaxID=1287657 RepID=UPI0002F5BF86|nr:hypothetical protein [Robertmurraya massiliosenegalensis]